jgi:FMN-dependent NADH-azoreductase
MGKLLYIECSPRRDNSYSAKVARAFLTPYRELHPDDDIHELELWRTNLRNLADAATDAKYAKLKRTALSAAQQEAWDEIVAAIEQFKAADKYLLSVPMWNFAIPYVLKHYIDVLVQPGLAFAKDAQGRLVGLVTGRPALCVLASGSAYPGGIAQRHLIGTFLVSTGPLHRVVHHRWYASLQEADDHRRALAERPGWSAFADAYGPSSTRATRRFSSRAQCRGCVRCSRRSIGQ